MPERELAVGEKPKQLTPEDCASVPALVQRADERAAWRFLEFFAANIRNKSTRAAYARAVRLFFEWRHTRGLEDLERLNPVILAAYVEQLGETLAKLSVKQHLAAIRMLLDYLVTGGVLPFNPAAAVRGPKHAVKRGKTPVLSAAEARQFLNSIAIVDDDGLPDVVGLRDRALIGLMVYDWAGVSRSPDWRPSARPPRLSPPALVLALRRRRMAEREDQVSCSAQRGVPTARGRAGGHADRQCAVVGGQLGVGRIEHRLVGVGVPDWVVGHRHGRDAASP